MDSYDIDSQTISVFQVLRYNRLFLDRLNAYMGIQLLWHFILKALRYFFCVRFHGNSLWEKRIVFTHSSWKKKNVKQSISWQFKLRLSYKWMTVLSNIKASSTAIGFYFFWKVYVYTQILRIVINNQYWTVFFSLYFFLYLLTKY